MILFILLISIGQTQDSSTPVEYDLVTTLTSACRCSQLLSELDCNLYCFWIDNKDGTGECRDKVCSDYIDATSCNNSTYNLCYYNNADQLCQSLRGDCIDLTPEQCAVKGSCTVIGDTCNDTSTPAVEENSICIQITNEADCNQTIETNSGYFCAWNSTSNTTNTRILYPQEYQGNRKPRTSVSTGYCTRFPVTKCSDIDALDTDNYTKALLCNRNEQFCRYSLTDSPIVNVNDSSVSIITYSCQQRACGDYGSELLCKNNFVVPDYSEILKVCSWNATSKQCSEGMYIENYTAYNSAAKFFTKENCYSDTTLRQLTWNQNTSVCTKCPGWGQILSAILAIYILIV